MSENIRGITFAEQAVTPADDAIVRRAILGDGILTGCEISYSGSTLTMAAGYIIACGRAFQITSAQNWAVVDATSGFARLLVTLDLTKTATEETFGQIEFSLEYAASEDGFLALVQEDINLSGAKYQIVAAVVSLGTGGITGIVSKLERAEGGGLNFKVVAGLTQPVSATENTIWVKTEKMTGWIFDANQPENLDEGMVWISASPGSAVQFNALRKNGIRVYPKSAVQRVGNTMVGVEAKIYQAGKWIDLRRYLYNSGDKMEEITGGYIAEAKQFSPEIPESGVPTISDYADRMEIYWTGLSGASGIVRTAKKIDLTGYFTLNFEGTIPEGGEYNLYGVFVWSSIGTYITDNLVAAIRPTESFTGQISIPIADVMEECYIGFAVRDINRYLIVERMWLA